MDEYLKRAGALFSRINKLALISEDETGITRSFGTDAFLRGSEIIVNWMQQAGLQTWVDAIGNVRGKLLSPNRQAKTLVIASHMDTVVNAGRFDGPLGVLLGLDLLEHLMMGNTTLPFHIELIAFSDEEGVRFHTTYLGSKVVAGSFDNSLLQRQDRNGITLKEAIQNMGGDILLIPGDAIPADQWLGYYEVHIEQGPVLYESHIPVAIVTSIAGQKRAEIIFSGMAGHAGTVPMDMRNDALCCAADFIIDTERFALENKNELVATIGKLEVINPASNVIPGKVICSLDLRSPDEDTLSQAYHYLKDMSHVLTSKRNIGLEWNLVQETKPVKCDDGLSELLKQAIIRSNLNVIELVSGAGHDAVAISQAAPVAMLFVRCFEGISHNPLENAELTDVAAAIQVSDHFIEQLIKKYDH